ncbi:hypothetical protein TNIN_71501 [Trichonephila inaurata madagascariensis]|uniref:Uncharacterized protein n=1 Tax=Trichonephila inaurata madagascariensis TaxID=2747483 RepID=A0A8X6YLE4_9ARAC|nr:hypothetical protein TNIN_71501 [Trichonephila inaurata madagascariensis]
MVLTSPHMNLSAEDCANIIGSQTLVHGVMDVLPIIWLRKGREHKCSIRSHVSQTGDVLRNDPIPCLPRYSWGWYTIGTAS